VKEFLERTDSAGNQIYTTKTGEVTMQNETLTTQAVFPQVENIPDPKSNLIIAEMCFPKDQLMEMLNAACVTKDQVEEMIEEHDMTDCVESLIGDIDWEDKVTDVLSAIDIEDYMEMSTFTDSVLESLDYRDIASNVKEYIEEPDAESMARNLLETFNYESPCHTGQLYIKSVEEIIEGYMKKQMEGVVQPTVIVDNVVRLRAFTIQEINEVLDALQYTEYNKSRILTSLSLK
jgi:hypothetical protein